MQIKPEIKVSFFARKDKNADAPTPEPSIDYVAAAEAAATRIGKKLVVGASVVSVVTIAAATLGSIAVIAVKTAIEK